MKRIFRKNLHCWRQEEFIFSTIKGFFLFLTGAISLLAAKEYLTDSYIHIVGSPDLFLDILPVTQMENLLVWGIPTLFCFTCAALIIHPERLPFTLKTLGILCFIRAFFIILTPMGVRPDQVVTVSHSFLQSLAYSGNDFFFSGHVAFPFLLMLIFWDEFWMRICMLFVAGIFAVSVLLAHTHYSIDVFAVPFIVPTIYGLSRRLFHRDLTYSSLCP
jgi:hypothetical protein